MCQQTVSLLGGGFRIRGQESVQGLRRNRHGATEIAPSAAARREKSLAALAEFRYGDRSSYEWFAQSDAGV
jgi:hypothetical protein